MKLFEDEKTDRAFKRGQWKMLVMTIIGYTLFYCMRKNFSFAMPGLEQDFGVSKAMLGNCLFAGGIVYGISKFINGFIGDRVKAKNLFCIGLLVCALVNLAFGFAPEIAGWIGGGAAGTECRPHVGAALRAAQISPAFIALVLGVLLVINQLFQGTGFPPCAKLMAYWIPPSELATKQSLWNTSHSIGGGLVAKICGAIMALGTIGAMNQGVGQWRWCFWVMAAAGLGGVVLCWFFLPGTPEEEGLPPVPGTEVRQTEARCPDPRAPSRVNPFRAIFLNPVVIALGLTNLAVNAARALIADWGPTMLQEAKHLTSSEAGTSLMFFEFAGILGMVVGGWVTDRFAGGRVSRVCVFMMALAAAALAAFWCLPGGVAATAALCVFGFMLYGPQALTGVAVTNLCGKRNAGTSIGYISLYSYIGASLSGKFCGSLVQSSGGWALPVEMIGATVAIGALIFACLWRVKADNYG